MRKKKWTKMTSFHRIISNAEEDYWRPKDDKIGKMFTAEKGFRKMHNLILKLYLTQTMINID